MFAGSWLGRGWIGLDVARVCAFCGTRSADLRALERMSAWLYIVAQWDALGSNFSLACFLSRSIAHHTHTRSGVLAHQPKWWFICLARSHNQPTTKAGAVQHKEAQSFP